MNYYPDDDPSQPPQNRWRSHAHLLYGNWIAEMYLTTPFDIDEIGTLKTAALLDCRRSLGAARRRRALTALCGAARARGARPRPRLSARRARIVEVDGASRDAMVDGRATGPDLVLIHGASGNLRDFTHCARAASWPAATG